MIDSSEKPTPADKKPGKSSGAKSSKAKSSSSRAMPMFQDIPPRHTKGTRRFVIGGLILAIAVPVGIGALFYFLRSLVTNPQ
jgi:hypothetical protein